MACTAAISTVISNVGAFSRMMNGDRAASIEGGVLEVALMVIFMTLHTDHQRRSQDWVRCKITVARAYLCGDIGVERR